MKPNIFCFDVESAGLYGEGFAVGGGLYRPDGATIFEFLFSLDHKKLDLPMSRLDREWLDANIPIMQCETGVEIDLDLECCLDVRARFWEAVNHAQFLSLQTETEPEKPWIMVVDCGWPVEARFLLDCIRDNPHRVNAPYPLHDLSTMLLASGQDPVGTYGRLPNELPKHNPLCDARQTVRLWRKAVGLVEGKEPSDKDTGP